MAAVHSLGLHEPSALPYLVAESILPPNPANDLYHWQPYGVHDCDGKYLAEEEVLTTKACVVWSSGGVIKRVFNLGVEGKSIVRAFVTQFPSKARYPSTVMASDYARRVRRGGLDLGRGPHSSVDSCARALVVVLNRQAHIYYLSGSSHILPFNFEAENAVPTAFGFLLQRKLAKEELDMPSPSVPPTSFTSSRSNTTLRPSHLLGKSGCKHDKRNNPPSTLPTTLDKEWFLPAPQDPPMPRVFSCTDPYSELGLVVERGEGHKTSHDPSDDVLKVLSVEEEIIHVSDCTERITSLAQELQPPFIAVTSNTKSSTYTVWSVAYNVRDDVELSQRRRSQEKKDGHHRRSSNVFGRTTGASTPIGRVPGGMRQSFGTLAHSQSENILLAESEAKPTNVEELAAELGSDFAPSGVQTRASRRVSSLLARTDLAMGHDRATFSDIGTGQDGRKSLNRSFRRGDSLTGFSDRQSFGPRRKSSFPGSSSVMSNGTSFLDIPVGRLISSLDTDGDLEGLESGILNDSTSHLPREIVLTRIDSFARMESTPDTSRLTTTPKVYTLVHPQSPKRAGNGSSCMSICFVENDIRQLTVVDVDVQKHPVKVAGSKPKHAIKPSNHKTAPVVVQATGLRKYQNVIDACRVCDSSCVRLLVLVHTRQGAGTLYLKAPWSPTFRVDIPAQLMVYDTLSVSPPSSPSQRREIGLKRVMNSAPSDLVSLQFPAISGRVTVTDKQDKRHRIQIQLEPQDLQVKKVLSICRFVLRDQSGEGLLIAWWEVQRWLRSVNDDIDQLEWTAVVMVLFSMAVPFLADRHSRSQSAPRRKKGGFLRSHSGSATDMSSWDAMMEQETSAGNTIPCWLAKPSWDWIVEDENNSSRSSQTMEQSSNMAVTGKQNAFILRCASFTRDFLQSPAGEACIGPEGCLPTAVNEDRNHRRDALATVLVGVHLLREEQKLDTRSAEITCSQDQQLAPVLAQIGHWLAWEGWSWKQGYYHTEIVNVDQWLFDENHIVTLELPPQPFDPPSIYTYLEACFASRRSPPFPTILQLIGQRSPTSKAGMLQHIAEELTPMTFTVCQLTSTLQRKSSGTIKMEAMFEDGLTTEILERLPEGISITLRDTIVDLQNSLPPAWSKPFLDLIGRDEMQCDTNKSNHQSSAVRSYQTPSHEAQRDYHSLGSLAFETEAFHSWDTASEADRQAITRMIFREDRRFQEASKIVNQLRPPIAECTPDPGWTESDLLDAQKDLIQFVARRTLAVSSGRGMMNFNARVPLLTEKVPIPAFTLQCIMKPRNGNESAFGAITLSADRAQFTEDKVSWAFFHNGASAGLMISQDAKGIDTSWILYNKPPEFTNRHAGFLLALGLNGHLKNLAKWVAFKYLTPKHTMTSIGLLLGLSSSYIGTMDAQITRLLSVHVTRLLPPGAAELNLSPATQTTSIMGIGLVYCSSQHRRMSEVMLSEIENTDPEEGVAEECILRDEGYRLAAGFSLGFINLGQGKRLHGLHDMSIVERLLTIAIGTKNVNLVHILDRATAGAVIALALVFMKTDDESIATKIDVPDTVHQFDYVRPDIFLLRTVARHLILWSTIQPTQAFMRESLPKSYRERANLRTTRHLSTEDMPFFNIIAGLCLSIGLRFAGSASLQVRELLVGYLDQFIRLTCLPALNYDAKLTRNSVRNCQDIVALATAAVMAGTGDLIVFRRLRSLHGRVDADTPYGSHLATHMAIGALFLGGGTHTFGTSNRAVASLLCAFYPLLPTSVLDNRSHLQAFRHLWVLAAEPRCLIPRDVDTHRPISLPFSLIFNNGEEKRLTAPCLLPELSEISVIKTKAPEHWDVVLDFAPNVGKSSNVIPPALEAFKQNQSIYLRRRAAYDAAASSVFVSALQALAEGRPAPSVSGNAAIASYQHRHGGPPTRNPLEWLFERGVLRDLDVAERALVLPPTGNGIGAGSSRGLGAILRGTAIDSRLTLENAILDDDENGKGIIQMTKDGLWQLRLLFAWIDALDHEEEERRFKGVDDHQSRGTWLRREVIEKLRWRVWKMGGGGKHDESTEPTIA